MEQLLFVLGYIVLVLLAIRFVKAHERGADALKEIAQRLDRMGPRSGS